MNKLDIAIAMLEDAKKQVNKPNYMDVQFQKYQDDLKLARRMILDMYGVDYNARERVYKEISGYEID